MCWLTKMWRNSRSHEDLENAAQQLYSSPHPLKCLKMSLPLWAQPSKIKLKKVWVHNCVQLQQQMGVFQASIMETLQSLRDKNKSVKNPNSGVGVDQISTSDPKPGLSKQPDLQKSPSTNVQSNKTSNKPMETDSIGPSLPPQFVHRFECQIPSDPNSKQSKRFAAAKPKK